MSSRPPQFTLFKKKYPDRQSVKSIETKAEKWFLERRGIQTESDSKSEAKTEAKSEAKSEPKPEAKPDQNPIPKSDPEKKTKKQIAAEKWFEERKEFAQMIHSCKKCKQKESEKILGCKHGFCGPCFAETGELTNRCGICGTIVNAEVHSSEYEDDSCLKLPEYYKFKWLKGLPTENEIAAATTFMPNNILLQSAWNWRVFLPPRVKSMQCLWPPEVFQ